jgi:predicted N-formylglutamate amidohydrolase
VIYEWTDPEGDEGAILDADHAISAGYAVEQTDTHAVIEIRREAIYLNAKQVEEARDFLTGILEGLKAER